jgi:hypothetical protein
MCSRKAVSRVTLFLAVLVFLTGSLAAQKFLPDDPVQVDHDDRNIPAPRRHKLNDYYDFVENSFLGPGDRLPRTAMNINTLGELPDSAWYTNRHARRRLTIEELARGPDRGTGPDNGPWTILRGKTEGITPGFSFIRDSRGDLYAIKFDPPGYLEMATSADVIGTKFFYAMGYHVPENYIVYFRPEQLELGENATITDEKGRERRMDHRDIQEVLNRVARTADGRYRAVASKILAGQDLGPFRYYGTRPDDPNDVFPHEHRRELRGLWVMSAWLNHDDSRAINTLDMLVKENGRQFVRHHLIDFGSILGSGSVIEQKPRAGNEYMWEARATFLRMAMLGFWDRPWIFVNYPSYPSIGRIEAEYFRPEIWKPEYPNAAFRNCLPEDAYWAAKIVMSFTDEEIRAIVKTGQITDETAEQYLIQCIIKRRDKVGRYWLNRVVSSDNFRVDEAAAQLHFEDVAVRYGFAPAPVAYQAQWQRFENQQDRKSLLGPAVDYVSPPIRIPSDVLKAPEGSYFSLQIRRLVKENPKIPKALHAYFRRAGGRLELVGIEREE